MTWQAGAVCIWSLETAGHPDCELGFQTVAGLVLQGLLSGLAPAVPPIGSLSADLKPIQVPT